MILRMLGTGPLAQLMGAHVLGVERPPADSGWLLHGPTDEAVVEPAPAEPAQRKPMLRWAAE